MGNPAPMFIDASGTTIRIDTNPRPGQHVNVMVSIMTQDDYGDNGDLIHRGQRIQFWVTREKAKQISEAFYVAHDENISKLMGKP
jgi:hypothetical protein